MIRNKSFDGDNLVYLISSPIGNLGEFSSRAQEVVSSLDVIACEDTRNTKSLLDKFGIKKTLFSLREHNEREASNALIRMVKEGKKVGYMSDAGYPGISDPGAILVKVCLENGIKVSVISGASAFLNALVGAGKNTDHFYFYGFLSPKEKERKDQLTDLFSFKDTLIFYESPHRINETLESLYEVFGNRNATIARELTKRNEEYLYGTLEEFAQMDTSTLIGEMVIVVEGNQSEAVVSDEMIIKRVGFFLDKGLSHKDACEIVAEEYSLKKNYIYQLTVKK